MVPIKLGCFELYLIKNNGGFLLLNYAVKAKTSMIGYQNAKTFFQCTYAKSSVTQEQTSKQNVLIR